MPVAEKLTRPHWLVAEWIEDREKRRREALRSGEEWRIRNAPPSWSELDMRRHRLLDAIFKAVEERGGSISKGDKGLARATIEGEKIDFLIREKSRQVKVPPDDNRRSYMTTDLVGTGKLVLAIRTYLRGSHNEEWRETDGSPLELLLAAFVDRLFEGAQVLKAWHVEQQEDRKRWAEEAARRAALERQRADDKARRDKLVELSSQWQTARNLQEMLTGLLSATHDPATVVGDRSVEEWVKWAQTFIAELQEPVANAHSLFRSINDTKAGFR